MEEQTSTTESLSVLTPYENLINLEISHYHYFNFAGKFIHLQSVFSLGNENEVNFDNVLWVKFDKDLTVIELAALFTDYGDTQIVKDTKFSAFVEFIIIYDHDEDINVLNTALNEKYSTQGIRCFLYKDRKPFKAIQNINKLSAAYKPVDLVE